MKIRIVYIVMVMSLLITGCGPNSSSSSEQGLPGQAAPLAGDISTPGASVGTVTGRLTGNTPGALTGLALYFGTILPLTPGPDYLINLDLVNSPKTSVREDGSFLMENITPGKYVLVLWTPHTSHYVPDPNNPEHELIVEVIGGKIVDLGALSVPSLP